MISISIIVPVYNVAEYLLKCLNSVANQSYTSNVECVIVDDCGTDDSIELAQDFINAYQGPIFFRIIHHKENKGLSGARNTGILESKGLYLYFLDSDDYLTCGCLESFVKLIEKYDQPDFIIGGSSATKGFPFFSLENRPELPECSADCSYIKRIMLHRSVLPMTAWNKMIKRSFLLDNSLFFKEGIIHEDEYWNLMIVHSLKKLVINKCNTYVYNIRSNSIITNKNVEKSALSWLEIWKLAIELNTEPQKQYHLMVTWSIMINSLKFGRIPSRLYAQYFDILNRLQSKMKLMNRIYATAMRNVPNGIYSNDFAQKIIRRLNNFFVYRLN